MKLKPIVQGYSVVNTNTRNFVDCYNGDERRCGYETWSTTHGPQEVIDELRYFAENFDNINSRRVKHNLARKYYQIVRVDLVPVIVKHKP